LNETPWKPLFASGELINDYEPLRVYLEEARRRGREDLVERALLSQEDFSYLSEALKSSSNLLELMEKLKARFIDRVDGEVAVEAFRKLGLNVDVNFARDRIAYIIAGWLLEAGKHWKILSFKSLPPS